MILDGTDNADSLAGGVDDDTISGLLGNDTLTGAEGNDQLFGGGGDDILEGDDGNDELDGGDGNDSLTGGLGTDTAGYRSAPVGVEVNLEFGYAAGGAGADTLVGIEHVLGSDFNDTLVGDAGPNGLWGHDGEDSLEGAGGDDEINAHAGNDLVDGGAGDDFLTGGDGDDTLAGGTGQDTFVLALVSTDTITDFSPGAGGDLLYGPTGLINYVGGTNPFSSGHAVLTQNGLDTWFEIDSDGPDGPAAFQTVAILVNVDKTAVTSANFLEGFDPAPPPTGVGATEGNDSLNGTSGPDSISGLGGNDLIYGFEGDDFLAGDQGDDSLEGGSGNDTLNGSEGFDAVSHADSSSAVVVDLAAGSANGAGIGSDTFTSIEAVIGSDFNDSLNGSDIEPFESFEGRGGNDTLNGRGSIDRASYQSSPSAVSVNLAAGTASDGWGGTDTLQNIENAGGSANNDTLTGSSGANVLEGLGGDDSLAGGLGDDTLDGGAGDDTLDGGAGNDTAVFSADFGGYSIDADFLTGDVIVSGPDGSDRLIDVEQLQFNDYEFRVVLGSESSDTLDGGIQGDLIQGGGGNDDIGGGAGADALFGDEGNDSLEGGTGDDVLNGGTGNDTMIGGNGDDTFFVDSIDDVVIEAADTAGAAPDEGQLADNLGAGIDRVIASINYTLGSFVENLTLAVGNRSLTGSGNSLNNAIAGNAGNNLLQGLGGNDQIDGDAGRDTAIYAGQRSQYGVAGGPLGFTVNGTATSEGTDTLERVERLQFSDRHVALDLAGNAGNVAKILGAVFGSALVSNTVYVGVGLSYADSGMNYQALMQFALDYRLGPGASHASVVQLLYSNVIGSAPDAATAAYYTGLLDSGSYTPASLAVQAADTGYNAFNINLTGLAQAGLDYREYV